ncbi:hypothetical protein ACUSIJ_25495 [Pseudochelatococcus sp. B33]
MSYQVHFHAAGKRLIPVSKGAHFDAPSWLRHNPRLFRSVGALRHLEQAIDRRGAHRQDLVAYLFLELQMAIAFKRRQQNRQQRLEALAADSIGSFP